MGKEKLTFTDPQTGEEMESTWLARLGGGLVLGLVGGLLGGLISGLLGGLVFGPGFAGRVVLISGLVLGPVFGLVGELAARRHDRITRWGHHAIARYQHRRRQRILHRQEHPAVPEGALSRAQSPGAPIPTDTAVSRAEELLVGKAGEEGEVPVER